MPRCTVVVPVRSSGEDMVFGGRPSLGVALIFATFGFGADRFYVGQLGGGIALLILYLTGFGAIIGIPIEWLSSLSLVFAILTNRNTAFMYGNNVVFQPSSAFDKVIASLWIVLMISFIVLFAVVVSLPRR